MLESIKTRLLFPAADSLTNYIGLPWLFFQQGQYWFFIPMWAVLNNLFHVHFLLCWAWKGVEIQLVRQTNILFLTISAPGKNRIMSYVLAVLVFRSVINNSCFCLISSKAINLDSFKTSIIIRCKDSHFLYCPSCGWSDPLISPCQTHHKLKLLFQFSSLPLFVQHVFSNNLNRGRQKQEFHLFPPRNP